MKVWPEFFANNSSLALVVLQFEVNSSGEEDFFAASWLDGLRFNAISFVLLSPDDCSNSPGRSYVEEERISDSI